MNFYIIWVKQRIIQRSKFVLKPPAPHERARERERENTGYTRVKIKMDSPNPKSKTAYFPDGGRNSKSGGKKKAFET